MNLVVGIKAVGLSYSFLLLRLSSYCGARHRRSKAQTPVTQIYLGRIELIIIY